MLVIMLLQTVIWSCLLIFAPKVHWRVQPTAAEEGMKWIIYSYKSTFPQDGYNVKV